VSLKEWRTAERIRWVRLIRKAMTLTAFKILLSIVSPRRVTRPSRRRRPPAGTSGRGRGRVSALRSRDPPPTADARRRPNRFSPTTERSRHLRPDYYYNNTTITLL